MNTPQSNAEPEQAKLPGQLATPKSDPCKVYSTNAIACPFWGSITVKSRIEYEFRVERMRRGWCAFAN